MAISAADQALLDAAKRSGMTAEEILAGRQNADEDQPVTRAELRRRDEAEAARRQREAEEARIAQERAAVRSGINSRVSEAVKAHPVLSKRKGAVGDLETRLVRSLQQKPEIKSLEDDAFWKAVDAEVASVVKDEAEDLEKVLGEFGGEGLRSRLAEARELPPESGQGTGGRRGQPGEGGKDEFAEPGDTEDFRQFGFGTDWSQTERDLAKDVDGQARRFAKGVAEGKVTV